MVRLMLEAGLRVSEVVALELDDLNMTTCRLHIRDGKGGKDRTRWIRHDLRDQVGEWLERRPAAAGDWLFVTRNVNLRS